MEEKKNKSFENRIKKIENSMTKLKILITIILATLVLILAHMYSTSTMYPTSPEGNITYIILSVVLMITVILTILYRR